jgi:DNA polymerase-1
MTEKLFGIKYDKNNPDHKAKRTVVKTINFGLIYGMTWIRLFEECKLRGMKWSKNDCKNIIEQYWEMLPVLSEWFARLKIKAIQQGYTETMFGRRRYYSFSTDVINYCKNANTNSQTYKKLVNSNKLTPNDESQLRQAGNAVIQGTNADAIRVAMQLCDNIKGVELLLQIHDELVFQVPKGLEKYAKQQIKDTMESSIALDVPVIAEPVEAKRWGEAK